MRISLTIALGLLLAVALLTTAARRLNIAFPVALFLGGAALGLVPGLSRLSLSPDVVLLVVLPPLIYAAAWSSSWRDLRHSSRAISQLAIGLVLATTAAVAVAAHAALEIDWAPAFVLGAIVSPTDAIAATSVAARLGLPRRLVTILEGESLINDATGLVTYRLAIAAVGAAHFSLGGAVLQFVLVSAGGVLAGLAVGWLSNELLRRVDDPPVEFVLSLLTAYGAYLTGELLHVSGVLACVAAGLHNGRQGSRTLRARSRLHLRASWKMILFLLNGLVFTLLGLQLRHIVSAMEPEYRGPLIIRALFLGVVVVVVRMLYLLVGAASALLRKRPADADPPWQRALVLGWAGMRGAVSLALALALPLAPEGGTPFPGRDLIIFCTFVIIAVTLAGQGLTLPLLIGRLKIERREDEDDEREEIHARLQAAKAAHQRLHSVAREHGVHEDRLRRLHDHYAGRIARLQARSDGTADEAADRAAHGFRRLQQRMIELEREELTTMRNQALISDETLRRVERDLDLIEERL